MAESYTNGSCNRITSYNVCYTKLLRSLHVEILHDAGPFIGTFQPLDTQKGLDDQGRLINPDEAYRIKKEVSGQAGKIIEAVTEKKKKNPRNNFV